MSTAAVEIYCELSDVTNSLQFDAGILENIVDENGNLTAGIDPTRNVTSIEIGDESSWHVPSPGRLYRCR